MQQESSPVRSGNLDVTTQHRRRQRHLYTRAEGHPFPGKARIRYHGNTQESSLPGGANFRQHLSLQRHVSLPGTPPRGSLQRPTRHRVLVPYVASSVLLSGLALPFQAKPLNRRRSRRNPRTVTVLRTGRSGPPRSSYDTERFHQRLRLSLPWVPRHQAIVHSAGSEDSCACSSASRTMRSTSSLERPLEAVMVIFCSRPVALSRAVTLRIPLASISKVTSICGTPRGAGAMPSRRKRPRLLLSRASSRSPCNTWISTAGWLSSAVLKVSLLRVGIVVLRSINMVMTPPSVSTPSESGVTSSRSTSFTSPLSTPAWMAAPTATTSSGFTPLCGSLPVSSRTRSTTAGMRVEPPTRMMWSIWSLLTPASRIACSNGPRQASSRSAVSSWNLERESSSSRWSGPSLVAVMNGRLIVVCCAEESW